MCLYVCDRVMQSVWCLYLCVYVSVVRSCSQSGVCVCLCVCVQRIVMPHQWLEGNLPVNARCCCCDKTCGSIRRLQDFSCLWCHSMVRRHRLYVYTFCHCCSCSCSEHFKFIFSSSSIRRTKQRFVMSRSFQTKNVYQSTNC